MAGIGFYGGDPVNYPALIEQGIEAVPEGPASVLGAELAGGAAAAPTPRMFRAAGRYASETGIVGTDEYGNPVTVAPDAPIDADAANSEFGIPGYLKFDHPVTRDVARDLYEHQRDAILRQDVINRREGGILTGGAARFGANVVGGIWDPLGLAVGAIPILGEARVAGLLARGIGRVAEEAVPTVAASVAPEVGAAAVSPLEAVAAGQSLAAGEAALAAMSPVQRAALRGTLGGAQGAVGMAALQPLEFALSRGEQEDYTMADALRSIALGTLVGGGLHVVGGGLVDWRTGRYRNPVTQALEDAGPDVRQGALQGAISNTISGDPVNVAPGLELVDALRTEQNLGMYIRRQQQLTTEGDAATAAAAEAENRVAAATAAAQPGVEAAANRLDALRTQAELTRIELETTRGTVDEATPARLAEIDWEMAQPGLSAARRAGLVAERTMLTEGARVPTDLEAARTAAQVSGLETTLARQQRAVTAAETALQRQQAGAPTGIAPPDTAAFGQRVDQLAAQQQILQQTTERELRRVAGRLGIGLPPADVTSMAQRILAASPENARDVMWPILGDIVSRKTGTAPPIEGGIAGAEFRKLTAAGVPEREARAQADLTQARYETRAERAQGRLGSAEDIYTRDAADYARGEAGPLLPGELAQRGVTDTVVSDNAIESARTDQGQALPGRVPTGKGTPASALTDASAIPDLATLESNARLHENTVNAVGADPGLGHNGGPPLNSGLPRQFASAHAKAEYLINRLRDNLLWLYDQVPAAIRERSRKWYDGAQAIATEWAERWGLTRSQTAGMLAVLSPQKDWFMNTSMAERLGDILHSAADHRWDDAMDAQAFKFLLGETATSPANRAAYAAIEGKTLREVVAGGHPVETGMWLRAYDEAHHGSAHAIITPEGAYAGNMLTQAGDEARRAWGDFGAIGKAASIFFDGSPENISRMIGAEHKVRNFYNNIFNASDPRYVTIDTHAVAADELRPVAGNDKAVGDNFGDTGSDRATGLKGSYALHAEAYRRAAAERGILPREMQSITWEAVRGLFPDNWKTRANKEAVDAIWDRVGIGELSVEDARAQIHALASGASKDAIDAIWNRIGEGEGKISIEDARAQIGALTREITPPDWVGHDAASMVERTSTYPGTREAPAGARLTFEVAPDPRNPAVVARWNAIPKLVQDQISHSVAWNVAKSALEGLGEALWGRAGKQQRPVALKAELHRNNAAWRADANTSLTLQFDPDVAPAKVGIVSRLMGYALRQEETLHTSPKTFPGSEETGVVTVILPRDATPAQIHEVYQQIRELTNDAGEPYVIGHTTGASRVMEILNNNDRATIGTLELGRLIDEKLGGKYDVKAGLVQAQRVEAGSRDYGFSGNAQRRRAGEGQSDWVLRRAANNLRAEAQQHLEDQLTAYEGRGAAAEPGGELGVAGREPGVGAEPRSDAGREPAGGGRRGAASPVEAQRSAAEAAAGHPNLEGLPNKPIQIGDVYYVPGPLARAKEAALNYMRKAGLVYDPPRTFARIDPERAARIADAFEAMQHDPDNPAVKASYEALARETLAQWEAIKATGLKVEWIKEGQEDPYAVTPRLALMDIADNNHWWGFPTDLGYGTGDLTERANNPMLRLTGEVIDGRPVVVNDVFRIVHDYFGHAKEGVGFRAGGEENAWRIHAAMYSEEARGAMTSETRGQNSWVNYGPYAETNRTANAADTHYSPQKVGLLPKWVEDEGRADPPAAAAAELEQAGRAKIRRATADARALITLYRDAADPSSLIHENFHQWVDELFTDALHPDASPELVADAATLRRAVGAKEGEELTTEQLEQLAQWGEQYVREGRAPTPALQGVFDQFREWLLNIYQTISSLGLPITDEVRSVFDRMLTPAERERFAAEARGAGEVRGSREAAPGAVTPPGAPGIPRAAPVSVADAMREAAPRPMERGPAAGEPGGPRPSDTLNEINAQVAELERQQRAQAPGRAVAPELQAEAQAAADAVAEADARASAIERASVCIMRG